jgi:hypothetical protein
MYSLDGVKLRLSCQNMDLTWKLYFLTPLLHMQPLKHSPQQKQIKVKVQPQWAQPDIQILR